MMMNSVPDEMMWSCSSGEAVTTSALIYSLSVLKNKVNEVQSLLSILISPPQVLPDDHHLSTVTTVVQEIIVTASSMMFTCQQMMTTPTTATTSSVVTTTATNNNNHPSPHPTTTSIFTETLDWYNTDQQAAATIAPVPEPPLSHHHHHHQRKNNNNNNSIPSSSTINNNYRDDIIELDVAEILAKYTHYCQICGKGFKRDANLRMHMRAHGDEYKTNTALTNPDPINRSTMNTNTKKYSCPQEGCRWNQRHDKFQPLKSMICAKNHYKRSHCPKMYVCKRCNRKQFSVLSDLRTHEKHCGHSKWVCSCGTTFSRKDKLTGHVALFVGHNPMFVDNNNNSANKIEQLG